MYIQFQCFVPNIHNIFLSTLSKDRTKKNTQLHRLKKATFPAIEIIATFARSSLFPLTFTRHYEPDKMKGGLVRMLECRRVLVPTYMVPSREPFIRNFNLTLHRLPKRELWLWDVFLCNTDSDRFMHDSAKKVVHH